MPRLDPSASSPHSCAASLSSPAFCGIATALLILLDAPWDERPLLVLHDGPPEVWWLLVRTWSKRPALFVAIAGLTVAGLGCSATAVAVRKVWFRRAAERIPWVLLVVVLAALATLWPTHPPAGALRTFEDPPYAPLLTLTIGAAALAAVLLGLAIAQVGQRGFSVARAAGVLAAVATWVLVSFCCLGCIRLNGRVEEPWWNVGLYGWVGAIILLLALPPWLGRLAWTRLAMTNDKGYRS